jgi:SAM-dependent methyltransferase
MEKGVKQDALKKIARFQNSEKSIIRDAERELPESERDPMPPSMKEEDLLTKLVKRYGKESKLLFRVIRGKEYHRVVQDLVAYTGLTFDEVMDRVALRHGDHGHFAAEFDWDRPRSQNELNWFYRSCKNYLFGNASRAAWEMLDVFGDGKGLRVLDFGGGIGQNTLALLERGHRPVYFDVSILQADFVRFRLQTRRLTAELVEPYYANRFNFLECIPDKLAGVAMQDVLEHIPRYPLVLRSVAGKMNPGSLLVEYSPFNGKMQGAKMPKLSPLHCTESIPLEQAMQEAGLEKTNLGRYPANVWRKK